MEEIENIAEKVKGLLAMLYPQAPVSVVNCGVNGSSASAGYERLKRDVLAFSPDLLVVCFGLNDANAEMDGLETYKTALRNIFTTAREAGIEVIFMTPNMLNTYSADDTYSGYKEYSYKTAEMQNSGRMLY